MEKGLTALSLAAFRELLENEEMVVLDSRPATVFTKGFIPEAISIGLEGRFTEWAASLVPLETPLLVVADKGREEETVRLLHQAGFTNVQGYLEGGFETWLNANEPIDMIIDVEADELAMDMPFDKSLVVVDVRSETEFADGHVQGAINIPLLELTDPGSMANIEELHNLYIHCVVGYRSVIAASMMKRQGIHNLRNVVGGYQAIENEPRIEKVKEKSALN